MTDLYEELQSISRLPGKPRVRYARMLGLLRRICLKESEDFKSDYSTLFSRLSAVCKSLEIDLRPADRFRRHARLVLHEEKNPSAEEEKADLADLACFISQVTKESIPLGLPQSIRPLRLKPDFESAKRDSRGVVTEILSGETFKCLLADDAIVYTVGCRIDNEALETPLRITRYLRPSDNVYLLDLEVQSGKTDVLTVSMVIAEPDYLLDISSLTATIKPYGASPLNYLLDRLLPVVPNRYKLLGNLANRFMDDCVNAEGNSEGMYQKSLAKNFQEDILSYACLPDEEVDSDFFEKARLHFNHIHETVISRFPADDIRLSSDSIVLEPSFISPALGLRGRLDVMTADFRNVLELKSGRAREADRRTIFPREEHLLQMSLYGEMLRRNFGVAWGGVRTFLFYSRYPRLIDERTGWASVRSVLHLRNGIVYLLRHLMNGGFSSVLPLLNPSRLNQAGLSGRFYSQYIEPSLTAATQPIQKMENDRLLKSYFSVFLSFVLREQYLAKTSDNRPDSLRGFAAAWTADVRTKLLAGNILTGLRISKLKSTSEEGISAIEFTLPDFGEDFVPNFSKGEMVQVYRAEDEKANVANRQLVRATVLEISADTLVVELAYSQRNPKVFPLEATYNVEHDASDSSFQSQLSALYSLLVAPARRRDLVLGRVEPKSDPSVKLLGEYPESINKIVLKSKQAVDYFLLVGPPGTGKTNLALRAMTKEFLLSRKGDENLLLTAYTNRAVDEICGMLEGLNQEMPCDYLRIGRPQTCASEYHERLLSSQSRKLSNRKKVRRLIDGTPIVVGTVLTLTGSQVLFRRKRFKLAIVDEASQLLEPQILGLFTAAIEDKPAIEKFVFIGDHKQLPAVVTLSESQTEVKDLELRRIGLTNLRRSFFERLHERERNAGRTDFTATLTRQGRMHPDIAGYVNAAFYGGELEAVPLPHQTSALDFNSPKGFWETFVASTRLGFVDTKQVPGVENIRANRPEAVIAARLVQAIVSLNEKSGLEPFSPTRSIGIIVPFRSQIACIRGVLRAFGVAEADAMSIDTVECYQGSQRDYIIFSTTISRPYQLEILSSVQTIEGIAVDRKLNVALTRARKQCFIIGDALLLSESCIYRGLIKACKKVTAEE